MGTHIVRNIRIDRIDWMDRCCENGLSWIGWVGGKLKLFLFIFVCLSWLD